MSLQLRLSLLAAALLLGTMLTTFITRQQETDELTHLLADAERRLTQDSRHWQELSARSLQRFVDDYSWWDEMVDFVRDPSPEWAHDYLEDSFDFWSIHGVWVFAIDGSEVYHLTHPDLPELKLPLTAGELLATTQRTPFAHFYRWTSAGLLEISIAPIQPTGDDDRETPPQGWFVAGRIWDQAKQQDLQPSQEYQLTLQRGSLWADSPPSPLNISATHKLTNEQGEAIATWAISRPFTASEVQLQQGLKETTLLLAKGLAIAVLFACLIHLWVIRPIRAINQALVDKSSTRLDEVAHHGHELGNISRLIKDSFSQEKDLREETSRRRQTETDLRRKEERLRTALQERARLGTDLHDNTIQILYATGLNLATIEAQITASHPETANSIKELRSNLQDGINDLRQFIAQVETDRSAQALIESIEAILALVSNTTHTEIVRDIDPAAAEQLSPDQRAHLLQILREAVTNTLRHAQADYLRVALAATKQGAHLTIEDNGIGISPGIIENSAGGLRNLRDRAHLASAELSISQRDGNGTRIDLNFVSV